MGPPIQVFLTSIASAPALRQRQEHLLRILQVKKIPFTSYDLASDEEAKKLWRRKAPANNASPPGILVGGEYVGGYSEFDEAVEFGELDQFFKLNEPWGEEDEALLTTAARTPQKPIGVPGVATPSQITGQKPSFQASPSKPPKNPTSRAKSLDVGNELGFGLEGIKVSEEEMLELVESLGLGGDDAGDLVKGLGLSSKPKSETTASKAPAPAASNSVQAPTTAIKASPDVLGGSGATTAAPSSKDQAGKGLVTKTAQGATAPGPNTAQDTTKAKDSTAHNTAQSDKALAKDLPTSASPKESRTDVPDSAAAVVSSGNDTQLPSATNDEKNAAHSQPQGNAASNVTLQESAMRNLLPQPFDLHRKPTGPLFLDNSYLPFRSCPLVFSRSRFASHLYLCNSRLVTMSPYYTGPVPTAPRFWDMKATSVTADNNIDRNFHMPGHFDMRSLKDTAEIVSSPDSSEYYTPNMTQDGFINSVPSTAYCTPESVQISERRATMYHHCSSPESPSVSPSPSPTDSMFSRPSRPDSATSFVESADECHGHKRSPHRQRSLVPSLVVTDYDSDEDHKPRVDAPPVQQPLVRVQPPVQRSVDLRAEAVSFQPRQQARDPRQTTSVPMPSINGNATPVVRPQARALPQYTLPPRSHPFANQGMNQLPRPVAPATVAPRYKQVPAFQVVPRRFPTPKPVLAMRMASVPQPPMQPMQNLPQARGTKPQTQQQSTLYDSRGQTFEGKTVTVRPSMPRVPAMPLSSVRHLWPASGAALPNVRTNPDVWHPSLQEAESIVLIQQARILNGFSNGIPYGGGLYLPIPFDENFA